MLTLPPFHIQSNPLKLPTWSPASKLIYLYFIPDLRRQRHRTKTTMYMENKNNLDLKPKSQSQSQQSEDGGGEETIMLQVQDQGGFNVQ